MRAIGLVSASVFLLGLTGCEVPYRPLQPFTSKDGNFTCVFPGGEPTWRKKAWSFPPIEVAEGRNPGIEFAAGFGDCIYAASTSDLPKIYSDMKDKVAAEFKATIVYQGEAWIDGYKGYEFVLRLPKEDGRMCKMRAAIIGKRAYIFGIVAEKADLNSADAQNFLSSFKLIDKPKVAIDPSVTMGSTAKKR